MYRLKRYGAAFKNILASSNTTKSRFLRLYIISCILTLGLLPVEIYVLVSNLPEAGFPSSFDWAVVHNPQTFQYVLAYHSAVFYDRWVNVVVGLLIFFLFGLGRDAKRMYRRWLLVVGLGRVFPGLQRETGVDSRSGSRSQTQTRGSAGAGGKGWGFFKMKPSMGTTATTSTLS